MKLSSKIIGIAAIAGMSFTIVSSAYANNIGSLQSRISSEQGKLSRDRSDYNQFMAERLEKIPTSAMAMNSDGSCSCCEENRALLEENHRLLKELLGSLGAVEGASPTPDDGGTSSDPTPTPDDGGVSPTPDDGGTSPAPVTKPTPKPSLSPAQKAYKAALERRHIYKTTMDRYSNAYKKQTKDQDMRIQLGYDARKRLAKDLVSKRVTRDQYLAKSKVISDRINGLIAEKKAIADKLRAQYRIASLNPPSSSELAKLKKAAEQ